MADIKYYLEVLKSGGKLKSDEFTPILEELQETLGEDHVLVRDSTTGEIMLQPIPDPPDEYEHPTGFEDQPETLDDDHIISQVEVNDEGHVTGAKTKEHKADANKTYLIDHDDHITVQHDMGKKPSVSIITQEGDEMYVTVIHINENKLTVTWDSGYNTLQGRLILN